MKRCLSALLLNAIVLGFALGASAVTVIATEDFDLDAASWIDATSDPLVWVASGGSDGNGYVTTTEGAINDPGTIQFRGNAANGASGGIFAGDWIDLGVTELSAFVRHDLAVPVSFFFRITTGTNFPAWVGIVPVPVAAGAWTEISLEIDPLNPLLIPEFGDFETIFGAVTNVQVGASVPLAFEGVPVTWDLDQVTIVPEPATASMLGLGLLGIALRRTACA